jgi:D-inositol-3-phosphate glycosyltransferase
MNMPASSLAEKPAIDVADFEVHATRKPAWTMEAALLTGCQDKHYALAIAVGLAANGLCLDVIGSDEVDCPELHAAPNLRFLNLRRGLRNGSSFAKKLVKVLGYYAKLVAYAARTNPKIFHILWNNELELVDRTLLMIYFKLRGKKVALTAHNVNRAKRDSKDSWLNHFTLSTQYRLCDHVFVHTEKMKDELREEFAVNGSAVTVIPYPINNAVPSTELTPAEAKRRLGLEDGERAVLFFGKLRPYKGVEYLLDAFRLLVQDKSVNYRLIIAGQPKKGSEEYLQNILQFVAENFRSEQVIPRFEFVADEEMEVYFKAADVLVLPYKEIFQSGILFVAYRFGLPVVATDVGSFREDIVEGKTGFVCKAGHPEDLAKAVEKYFASDLYRNLKSRRQELMNYANSKHSWLVVADLTCKAYAQMLGRRTP